MNLIQKSMSFDMSNLNGFTLPSSLFGPRIGYMNLSANMCTNGNSTDLPLRFTIMTHSTVSINLPLPLTLPVIPRFNSKLTYLFTARTDSLGYSSGSPLLIFNLCDIYNKNNYSFQMCFSINFYNFLLNFNNSAVKSI